MSKIEFSIDDPSKALPAGSWIREYVELASIMEAPPYVHFWAALWALSSTVARDGWFNQVVFKWYPSLYIVVVAPPGLIGKSAAGGLAADLLKEAEVVQMGPDQISSAAVLPAMVTAARPLHHDKTLMNSPLAFFSSELGNLIDPEDTRMMNQLIDLWDGREEFSKKTVKYGDSSVSKPFVSILGCTTPVSLNEIFTSRTRSNGFTSRCIFVEATRKYAYRPYLDELGDQAQFETRRQTLIQGLKYIRTGSGAFSLTPEARAWGKDWYVRHWKNAAQGGNDVEQGAVARKQAQVHKIAMLLVVSERAMSRVIELRHLVLAESILTEQESSLTSLFMSTPENGDSKFVSDTILRRLQTQGPMMYKEVFRVVYLRCPGFRDFDNLLAGLVHSGQVKMFQSHGTVMLGLPDDPRTMPGKADKPGKPGEPDEPEF